MGKILCTFSGKIGDILWSLPTVRQIAWNHGCKVDFACMHQYLNLIPLIQEQDYIASAFTMPDWICQGSPFGDQPWRAPERYDAMYEKVYHLTYKRHPAMYEKLALHISGNAGIELKEPVQPWLHVSPLPVIKQTMISYGFNEMHFIEKSRFIGELIQTMPGVVFINVGDHKIPFYDAARYIVSSEIFVGCRSSMHVMAHALGKKVIVFEPEGPRNWPQFQSPWGQEVQVNSALHAYQVLGTHLVSKGVSA